MKKIEKKIKNEQELRYYEECARMNKLVTSLITDAGLTTIPAGTITCLGIGPDKDERIDAVVGKLKFL